MKSSNLRYVLFFASTVMASEIMGDPGEFYRQQHKNLVAQYDRDGDGFLDAGEREKMRNTPKTQGKGWGRGKKNEKKRVRRDMPKHWIEKYDKEATAKGRQFEGGKMAESVRWSSDKSDGEK